MNVIFISESSGKSGYSVRRILDRYASRIGGNSWESSLTLEGLGTVKSLLNRASSRKTSVSCHRISMDGQRILMWIVGAKKLFNSNGSFSTGWTSKKLKYEDASQSYPIRLIKRLASLAGLLHDIGKSNTSFQRLIRGESLKEVIRHEGVSSLMMSWLLNYQNDQEWINSFINAIDTETLGEKFKQSLLEKLSTKEQCGLLIAGKENSKTTPALFGLIWLIASHHILPGGEVQVTERSASIDASQVIRNIPDAEPVSEFIEKGLPWESENWIRRLREDLVSLLEIVTDKKFEQEKEHLYDHVRLFGRPVFQISDHLISSQKTADKNARKDVAYANSVEDPTLSDSSKRPLGQRLDRHLIDVSRRTATAADDLITMKSIMPGVEKEMLPDSLRKKSKDERFSWQDDAANEIKRCRLDTDECGFFGVLVASTGSGKTTGAMKIMSAFKSPMRVLYGSPLRSLTLQSGSEFSELGFASDDIATVIGDTLIQKMYEADQVSKKDNGQSAVCLNENFEIDEFDKEPIEIFGGFNGEDLKEQIRILSYLDDRGMRMVGTPVLAATIDTVMKLSDGRRGSYISHLLRIASSDLIIDEVDMFSPSDLIAIGRLIESAGFWRCKVMLSSATLSPIIAKSFLKSYLKGHSSRNALDESEKNMICGWFSNTANPVVKNIKDADEFYAVHKKFICDAIGKISSKTKIAAYLSHANGNPEDLAKKAFIGVEHLHKSNSIKLGDGRSFSFGCIQVVNVRHCQQIAIGLCNLSKSLNLKDKTKNEIRVVCLHGRLSLASRNVIEKNLNNMLNRKGNNGDLNPLNTPEVRDFAESSKAENLILILVSTMETTGRDHDFDWGIIESRQFRDIIQFAGRIRRHRTMQDDISNGNLIVFNAPLNWDGSNKGNPAEPLMAFSRFGVSDNVSRVTVVNGLGVRMFSTSGIKGYIFRRKNIDLKYGYMPTYSEMMHCIFGEKNPIISAKTIVIADVDSINQDEFGQGKTHAYTVRAAETIRMNNALLDDRRDKAESLTEWLNDGHSPGRLLNKHQHHYKFRDGTLQTSYWRDENNYWHYVTEQGREYDPNKSKCQGLLQRITFNESGLLLKFDEDLEIDQIRRSTNSFGFGSRVKLSMIRSFTDVTKFSEMSYHPQIGLL